MCVRPWFWKLCDKMAAEAAGWWETQQMQTWAQGLTSPQKAEAQCLPSALRSLELDVI